MSTPTSTDAPQASGKDESHHLTDPDAMYPKATSIYPGATEAPQAGFSEPSTDAMQDINVINKYVRQAKNDASREADEHWEGLIVSKEEELAAAKAKIAQLNEELKGYRRCREALTETEKTVQQLHGELYTTNNTLNTVRARGKQATKDLHAVTDERDDLLSIRRDHEKKISSLENTLMRFQRSGKVPLGDNAVEMEQLRQSHVRSIKIDEVLVRATKGYIEPPMTPNMPSEHIEIALRCCLGTAHKFGEESMRIKLQADRGSFPGTPISPMHRVQGQSLEQELAATGFDEMQMSPTKEETDVPLPEDDVMDSDDPDYIPPLSRSLSPPTEAMMIQPASQEQPAAVESQPGPVTSGEPAAQNVGLLPGPQLSPVMNFGAANLTSPFIFGGIPGLNLLPPTAKEPEKPVTVAASPSNPNIVSFGSGNQGGSFSFTGPGTDMNPFQPPMLFKQPGLPSQNTQFQNLNSMPNPSSITVPGMGQSNDDDRSDGPSDLELLDQQLEEGLRNIDEPELVKGGYTSPVVFPQSATVGPNFAFRMPSPDVSSAIVTSGVDDAMDVDTEPMKLDNEPSKPTDGNNSTLWSIGEGMDNLAIDSPKPPAPVSDSASTGDVQSGTVTDIASLLSEPADRDQEVEVASTASSEKSTLPDPDRPNWQSAADAHEHEHNAEPGFASSAPNSPLVEFNGSFEIDSFLPNFSDDAPTYDVTKSPEAKGDRSTSPYLSVSALERGFDDLAQISANGETSVVDTSGLLNEQDVNPNLQPESAATVSDEAASNAALATVITEFLHTDESKSAVKAASALSGGSGAETTDIEEPSPVAAPVQEEPGKLNVTDAESATDYEPVELKTPSPSPSVSSSPSRASRVFHKFQGLRKKELAGTFLDKRARLFDEMRKRLNEEDEYLPKIREVSEPSEADSSESGFNESGSHAAPHTPEKEIAETENDDSKQVRFKEIEHRESDTELGKKDAAVEDGSGKAVKATFEDQADAGTESTQLVKNESKELKLESSESLQTASMEPKELKEKHPEMVNIKIIHQQPPTEFVQDIDVEAEAPLRRSRVGLWASMTASSFFVTLVASIDVETAIFRLEQWAPVVRTMLG